MSQHDFNIANQGFPSTRTDINSALAALATNSSGSTEPATTYPRQFWFDETESKLKIRNSANTAWLTVPTTIGALEVSQALAELNTAELKATARSNLGIAHSTGVLGGTASALTLTVSDWPTTLAGLEALPNGATVIFWVVGSPANNNAGASYTLNGVNITSRIWGPTIAGGPNLANYINGSLPSQFKLVKYTTSFSGTNFILERMFVEDLGNIIKYPDGRMTYNSVVTVTTTAANTPASLAITWGATFTTAPSVLVTANSSIVGSTVTGVGYTGASTTGANIWATRTSAGSVGVSVMATGRWF